MKLKKLIQNISDLAVKGSKEIEITGICSNSKWVAPGNLFIVKKGLTHDGSVFISEALAAGAVAVLNDIYDPFLEGVVQLIHPDVSAIEARLAATYYRFPSDRLFIVGITGTNGKTTSSYLIKHLLDSTGQFSGLIGTVEWIVGKQILPSTFTTPDAVTNQKLLYEMGENGCKAAVMEVSSHALEQQRVREIEYDVAIFTNLTQDHLDYHKSMENYAAAKTKLFASLGEDKSAIVNADSSWTAQLLAGCRAKVISYGIDNGADVRASDISLSPQGTRFTVSHLGQTAPFSTSLIGRFNVYNCLAAISLGLLQGLPLKKIASILSSFKTVSGRLERVPNKKGLNIFVDYAHTDDALRNVLETLQEIKTGRLITVFGCGGDRDQGKRPKMGRVVEHLSDIAIVTSDNPRTEDPRSIIDQILPGFENPKKALIEVDRAAAIRQAIAMASPKDIVLIAGKGHENYQIFATKTIPFDDCLIAKTAAN